MIKQYIQTEILSKLEENKRRKEWKEKLRLIEAPISRFATPTSSFASSSLLLLQPSSMEVWERVSKAIYEPSIPLEPDSFSLLKAKTSSNRAINAWAFEASHKNWLNRAGERPPRPWQPPRSGRGCHHGPWWSPRLDRGGHWPSRFSSARYDAFCLLFWSAGLLVLGLFALGLLDLFASSLA